MLRSAVTATRVYRVPLRAMAARLNEVLTRSAPYDGTGTAGL